MVIMVVVELQDRSICFTYSSRFIFSSYFSRGRGGGKKIEYSNPFYCAMFIHIFFVCYACSAPILFLKNLHNVDSTRCA